MQPVIRRIIPGLLVWLLSAQAWAFGDNRTLALEAQQCFAVSMVGFDSVINSRMGVPPEHALNLVRTRQQVSPLEGDVFSKGIYGTYLLRVILDAYLWQESPHDYAVRTFYTCATEQDAMKQHQAEAAYE